ncbi:MAG: hypothetical protein Q7T89_12245, partial [Anaerolineales bacterium]|nr:hypothetical protein [Anaerolineales bacterium]
ALMKIRNQEKSLQEGSLEILEGLPNGILGFARKFENEKIVILLNFGDQRKEFQIKFSKCLFKLSDKDEAKEKAIRLNGLGGIILKIAKKGQP